MANQEQILSVLEDTANLLRKTQINLKKCPKSRLTKGYIEARIKIIDDYWRGFKSAHHELVKITPKEQKGTLPYFLNEEFFIYEDLYNVLQGDLKDMLNQLSEPSSSEKTNTSVNESHMQNSVLHLPKIHLPTFSGMYEQWPTFMDLYKSLVHENNSLNDVQKLHYLKTCVVGEAGSLLKHIQVTSSNYSHAWNILNARYGNKKLILNANMKRLFNQRKMSTQTAIQIKCLLDTTTETLNNFKNLNIDIGSWDPIIIYLLVQKLDPETHRSWEEYAYKDDTATLPTWNEFKKFLETKFRTLELVTAANAREVKQIKEHSCHVTTPVTDKRCVMCNDNHTLSHCKEFSKLEPKIRSEYAKNKKLCFNCLVPGHSSIKCKLSMSCRICNRRHHSLLHENKNTEPAATSSNPTPQASQHVVEEKEELHVNTMMASNLTAGQEIALLATAIVKASNDEGHIIPLRALIDQGSQATFITERATQLLKLKRRPIKGTVVGVGDTRTAIKQAVQFQIGSHWASSTSLPIQAYVMTKKLTTTLPTKTILTQSCPHLKGITLADPSYFKPGSIDLLLGVKEYSRILEGDLIKGPPGTPCAQKTSLGWILFGELNSSQQENTYLVMHHKVDVEDMLKSIWEIESDKTRHLTQEEKVCEDIYKATTTRNKEGRYVVKLPFKVDSPQSTEGNSKLIAKQRFMQLERKFRKSPDLKREYTNVINDYIEKQHMEIIPEKEKEEKRSVYLPHHAVIRNDKETTRTRVVFDASCKGSNNVSLNDELLVGPQLQEDLRNLLTRWRMKRVCFVADIQQMYRMILVTKKDADYQRLLWRPNETDDLQEYRLLRVTFGTSPAPFLAVRTLHQVTIDEGNGKTQASKSINENFYMDDYFDGADSVEEAVRLAKEVTDVLQRGGFILTKWSSNNKEFLESIDESKRSANVQVDLNLDGTIKALGIVWSLSTDTFQYNIRFPSINNNITKRGILSDIQKLFDPLGWIAPSTVKAKLLIQNLWLERVGWDEKVNEVLENEWRQIRSDFVNVNKIRIARWLRTTHKSKIQLHGFSDASMKAYAAVVYVRTETADNNIETRLVAARTRVAPIKTISLPRLELCGALLLSKLLKQIGQAMRISTADMYAWTDSSIVIAWLSGEPNRWKPFVANRVVEIVENLNNKHWYHVQSCENPADVASRGMLLSDLQQCDLWWKGPSWLSEKEIKISKQNLLTTDLELKNIKFNTYLNTEEQEKSISTQFEQFSNLTELLKAIIYCRRLLNYKKNLCKVNYAFTTEELDDSLMICIRKVQEEEFKDDIQRIKQNKQVKNTSVIRFLNPFLDEKNILRVGGRLRHANLPKNRKNPIILGNKNSLTTLIIAEAHKKTLHGGIQLMLCYLRYTYWILKAKSMIRKFVHKCFICAKLNATAKAQIMGDLPEERVTPARPFLRSGVDFAGPFQILMSKGRGNKTVKSYVAIFICLSTKAVHIELVGELTSAAFIGAFRRFVARRGKCSHLWSDQGRNFVGADKELRDALNDAKLQFSEEIAETLATEGTQWHFIPAYSPNFGGLWEAGVKYFKYHLKRILCTYLTYEEMTTILCQIEACLNSRPLRPLDDTDPEDLNPLTPGHFLIGEAPIVVPSPSMKDMKTSHLSRWQHTQKLLNDFWRRWQDEYLSKLQQRPKWLRREREFQIGDIVLIKVENLPPGKWSLGRIVDKHPGLDNITRVYSVKSGNSITKRTITKLCALPINSN